MFKICHGFFVFIFIYLLIIYENPYVLCISSSFKGPDENALIFSLLNYYCILVSVKLSCIIDFNLKL